MSNIKIIPEYFQTLKAQINLEMSRRNEYGTMVAYAGAAYQYTTPPASNGPILLEHIDKNLAPLRGVSAVGKPALGAKIFTEADKAAMDGYLSIYRSRPMNSQTNDCSAACSGLCVTQCTGECFGGCKTSCVGGCTSCTGCSGGCTDGCENNCNGNCDYSCFGYCSGDCGMMCAGGCQDSCAYGSARG